jgi:hypothetical protein
MKLDLLTNAAIADDAISFVFLKSIDKEISAPASGNEGRKESNKPDYDEDKYHLEEHEKEIRK